MMLSQRGIPVVLGCFYLIGSSLQAPHRIPSSEECPPKCMCIQDDDGMMMVECLTDAEIQAMKKPEPTKNLSLPVEMIDPVVNSKTLLNKESAEDIEEGSEEQVEPEKLQQLPNSTSESPKIVTDLEDARKEDKIADNELQNETEEEEGDEMPADEPYEKQEIPETLISDIHATIVAKKGPRVNKKEDEEMEQADQPVDDDENDEDEEEEDEKLDKGNVPNEKPSTPEDTQDKQTVRDKETVDANANEEEAVGKSAEDTAVENKTEESEDADEEESFHAAPSKDHKSKPEEASTAAQPNEETASETVKGKDVIESENQAAGEEEEDEEDENRAVEFEDEDKSVPALVSQDKNEDNEDNAKEEESVSETAKSKDEADVSTENESKTATGDEEEEEEEQEFPVAPAATDDKGAHKEEEVTDAPVAEDDTGAQEAEEEEKEVPAASVAEDDTGAQEAEEEEMEVPAAPVAEDDTGAQEAEEEEKEVPAAPVAEDDTGAQEAEEETVPVAPVAIDDPAALNANDSSGDQNENSTMSTILTRIRQIEAEKEADLVESDDALPDNETLLAGNIDEAKSGKIISEGEDNILVSTEPQQSTASWVILGLILGVFVCVLGYAAIRGKMNKKSEVQSNISTLGQNSIPPVFDTKLTRKPDYEGTELKELSRHLLQPVDEPVNEYKDKKEDELKQIVVAGKDTATLPFIDEPNSVSKPPRANIPSPLDLPEPNDTSRNEPSTPTTNPESSEAAINSPAPTTPTLVRTRIVDNTPQVAHPIFHSVNGNNTVVNTENK